VAAAAAAASLSTNELIYENKIQIKFITNIQGFSFVKEFVFVLKFKWTQTYTKQQMHIF
jgi:hypothetical protein